MLLKIKKVKTEEEVVELKLPAFFKNSNNSFFMITEEETLFQISPAADGLYISTWTKENHYNPSRIADVLMYKPVTAYEFFKQWHLSMDHLQKEMQQSLLTK